MASLPYRPVCGPRSTSIRDDVAGQQHGRSRTSRSGSRGLLASMPSIRTLVWFEFAPRMNTEVWPPGPPVWTTLRPGTCCRGVRHGAPLLLLKHLVGQDSDARSRSGDGRRQPGGRNRDLGAGLTAASAAAACVGAVREGCGDLGLGQGRRYGHDRDCRYRTSEAHARSVTEQRKRGHGTGLGRTAVARHRERGLGVRPQATRRLDTPRTPRPAAFACDHG